MVGVDDGELEGEFGAELEEDMQEADGIRASGDRYADVVARLEELVAGEGVANAVEKQHGLL